ncbi:uncharacterized protein LOC142767187 [Rhipicephalus microplus]|uniref:uncharacterized protein LOC142767187 n=1 Tax=Rhipicephalus microplus TaxID=6941 RepID=UPI003F6B1D86
MIKEFDRQQLQGDHCKHHCSELQHRHHCQVSCPIVHGVLADAALHQLVSPTFIPGESWFGVLPGSSLPTVRRLSSGTCWLGQSQEIPSGDHGRGSSCFFGDSYEHQIDPALPWSCSISSRAAALQFGSSVILITSGPCSRLDGCHVVPA